MTLTQFLAELRATRNGWYLVQDTHGLRMDAEDGACHCPVTAVCLRVKQAAYNTGEYELAGALLGLRRQVTNRIAAAADGDGTQWMRSRLLTALGLREEAVE